MLSVIGCTGVEEVGIQSGKWKVDKNTGKTTASLPGLVIRSEDDETAYAHQQQSLQTIAYDSNDLLEQMKALKEQGYRIDRIEYDQFGNSTIIVTKPKTSVVVLEPENQSRSVVIQKVEEYPQPSVILPQTPSEYNNEEGPILLLQPTPSPTPFPVQQSRVTISKVIEEEREVVITSTPTPIPPIIEQDLDPTTSCLNKELGIFGQRLVVRLKQLGYIGFTTCDITLFDSGLPIPIVFMEKKIVILSPQRKSEIGQLIDNEWKVITLTSEETEDFWKSGMKSKPGELFKCYYDGF